MFREPALTRFDIHFKLFGIPIRIHPLFWIIIALLGRSEDWRMTLMWVGVAFFSILIHELGHSFAMRRFGIRSHVVLYGFGGLAIPNPADYAGDRWGRTNLNPLYWSLIALAGPFTGFLFAGVLYLAVQLMGGVVMFEWYLNFIPMPELVMLPQLIFIEKYWWVTVLFRMLFFINVLWGLVNLVPVQPLDGGQALRQLMYRFDRRNSITNSLWISFLAGGVMVVASIVLFESVYMALLFGYLAYQSLMAMYQSRR